MNETTGIERSTPSLLDRILKSTIGLSDLIEKNNHSSIIQKQHDYFIKNSMLSDCYFYLGYVNKEIFSTFRDSILRKPDLMHILKISFDIDVDINLLDVITSYSIHYTKLYDRIDQLAHQSDFQT